MALNTIILPYNKISEVEECEPVSSPSSTSFEERKSVPDFNLLRTPFFHSYNLAIELSNKKCKSNPSSFDSHRLHRLFFGHNNNENISMHSQKEQTNLKNLNINQEKNKKNYENQLNDSNYEKPLIHINNNNSSRTNKNPFQRANNIDNIDDNSSESSENPFSKANLRKKNRESEVIDKHKLYKIYGNYTTNPKINPVKEDKQIDSFIEDNSVINNQIKSINTEDKNNSFLNRELPKIKIKINESSKINISPSFIYRNSNPNPIIRNGIYFKKKISDSSTAFGKKSKIEDNSINSFKDRDSIKTENREIKAKKRPLILNANLRKKKIENLKISQFQKIMKNDGLFYILRFLDYFDIINLFQARNKQLCTLINTSLANMYYPYIKDSLMKYSNIIELLKCTIVQSKIKEALKIDFILNIRFINNKKNKNYDKFKIKLGGPNHKFIEPIYLQFGYIYNYFQKVKNKKDLITKEEYENQIKRLKLYDYYAFDLYPEETKYNNNILKSPIYISKELSLFEKDGNNNIVNIQPILPFCINDKGIINLELYTTNNGFIDPDSIKIIIKSHNLKEYIKILPEKGINNLRISECEDLCVHWKNINLYQHHKSITTQIKKLFEPFFEINNIYFGNIGVFIFKVFLIAVKCGEINDKNKLEMIIKIKEKYDFIENEIRKNNLLFERRDIFELRVGDRLLYYFSLK
jgi:hypothetical protein